VPALLISGRPGVGKTTFVRRVLDALAVEAAGFYIRETRGPDGRRTGFELVTLDGRTATLARAGLRSRHRVGRYGVDLEAFERIGVAAIARAPRGARLLVVDEIGKMELLSPAFQRAVLDALDSGRLAFGTVMLARHPFVDALKARPDVEVLMLTDENRESLRAEVERRLRELLAAAAGHSRGR